MEDSLTFDGVLYISSKRAAKESGYTKDYVGQLARAGKIDARLVGRSWYVRADALHKHKEKALLEETHTDLPEERVLPQEAHVVQVRSEEIPQQDNAHMHTIPHAAPPSFFPIPVHAFREERAKRMRQDTLLGRMDVRFSQDVSFEKENARLLVPLTGKEKVSRKNEIPALRAKNTVEPRQISPHIITHPPLLVQHTVKKTRETTTVQSTTQRKERSHEKTYMIVHAGIFFITLFLICFALASLFFEKNTVVQSTGDVTSRLRAE